MKDMKNIFTLAALTLVSGAAAQNPVVQTWFTTDPAPLVHNDTLYLYTGHDEDKADLGLFHYRYGELDRSWLSASYRIIQLG